MIGGPLLGGPLLGGQLLGISLRRFCILVVGISKRCFRFDIIGCSRWHLDDNSRDSLFHGLFQVIHRYLYQHFIADNGSDYRSDHGGFRGRLFSSPPVFDHGHHVDVANVVGRFAHVVFTKSFVKRFLQDFNDLVSVKQRDEDSCDESQQRFPDVDSQHFEVFPKGHCRVIKEISVASHRLKTE